MRDREDAGGPRLNELPAEQRREVVGNVLKQYIGPGDNLVAGESRDAADARTPRERLPVRGSSAESVGRIEVLLKEVWVG